MPSETSEKLQKYRMSSRNSRDFGCILTSQRLDDLQNWHHFQTVVSCYCSQLFSASPVCHLVMKRSAASTIPRCQFPLFLAALGHSTAVSTPNSNGELSVDPSVASNTLMSSARHWAQFFSGRPRPGFTQPVIVSYITPWVSPSLL